MTINWTNCEVTIGNCGRVRCEPGWSLGPGFYNALADFDLWFVAAGRGHMQTRADQLTLRAGVCLWMRPGGKYLAGHDPKNPLVVNYIHFDLRDRKTRRRLPHLPPEIIDAPELAYLDQAMVRVIELTHGNQMQPAVGLMTGLLMDVEARAASERKIGGTQREHARIVQAVAAEMRENPANEITVKTWAENAAYSPDHFCRVFKKTIGATPQEYMLRIRIARAQTLLVQSEMSVEQIATALGYADLSFFSRQFKRKTGLTPTAWRAGRPVPAH